ncbi:RNA methyltransferase [Thioclava dalianensis]|uniref:RNA methyltransferase n=1 Tax=Thioclava dalianensis TaxID=1185766 RepID=A0A074TJT9_9RHOB|nr:class I SAM-dependent RNA methyltransferase [Thioclava dalianensis]KEP70440.1 RNA methyltransferase [Thioclava dalianensis]SFN30970.1 23S rRNA (uracil1939-C5)-methyltransferase [Thioclava dalianensis]
MTYQIERLSLHADGVAHGPEGTVHVAMALPGETVDGSVVDGKIAAPKIVTPSAERVAAPCPHYRACGGCAIQHASEEFTARWKGDVVRQALAARGIEAPEVPVDTSPLRSRRRATLAGRRTKKGAMIGFHARASDTLVEVPNCLILRPELMAVIPALNEATLIGGSRKGEIAFALSHSEAGVDVSATGGKETDRKQFEALADLARRSDLARLSWNGEVIAERHAPLQRFGAAQVAPPPGAFLQATAHGEAALVAFVRDAVGDVAQVADLFAGCGTFSLPLAAQAEVHAVEAWAAMTEALDQGWRQSKGLHRLSTEARDLFRRPLLPDEINRYDAVVIDPPRAGAESQVREICSSRLRRLVHVSCNPVTFAREAATLIGAGFRLERLLVVDQFRFSAHVEVAALFTR